MKTIDNYIIEKLHLNKNISNYDIVDTKDLDELKDWVHNEWNGEESFLISTEISNDDLDDLCNYMYELDANADEKDRAEYYYEPYNNKFTLFIVELNEDK